EAGEAAPPGARDAAGTPGDLLATLRLAVADVLPQAAARRIDIGLAEPQATPLPTSTAESSALRTVLRNLLENAVKYSPEGGRVDLALHADPQGRAAIVIDDSGPGIAPGERERVFDRFYRSPDLATQAPGSGLGLAIVRTLAQRQGIAIALDDAPGGGLRVTLTLPPG
ncbi:MAG: sensor histidine kinase, partial [Comamonas sp.]